MASGGEPAHVDAHLGDDDLSGRAIDPGNVLQMDDVIAYVRIASSTR